MKKLVLSLAFMLAFAFSGVAQQNSFAPQGAEWYFNVWGFMGAPDSYYHMEVLGDTVIQDHQCRIITGQFLGGNGDEQYVFEDNRVVYWYNQTMQAFTTLYDFNADEGDSWICDIDSCSFVVHVQSVDEVTWEGHTYRVQQVASEGGEYNDPAFEGAIIEGIGYERGLFPYPWACSSSIYCGGYTNYLRCYLVNDEMLYHEGNYDCEEYGNCWDGTVADAYAGGDGTEENPYLIANAKQLALFAQRVNIGMGSDACYKLTENINLVKCDGGYQQWESIGTVVHPFAGHFDGDGHTVLNMSQNITNGNSQVVAGLFGCTNGAEISNVNLAQCYIHGNAKYVGSLVGYAGLTNIYNCSIYDGRASTDNENGIAGGLVGLAGYIYGEQGTSEQTYSIMACQVKEAVQVESSLCAGGVIGQVNELYKRVPYVIDGCMMQGVADGFTIQGTVAGGVVGHMWYGTMVRCANNQKVVGATAGGLAGIVNYSSVMECINNETGQISNPEGVRNGIVGGIIGCIRCSEGNIEESNIRDCRNLADVSGTGLCGGIVGWYLMNHAATPSFIQHCYNHSRVTCHRPENATGKESVGGIVGHVGQAFGNLCIVECINLGDVVMESEEQGDAGGILGSREEGNIYIVNVFNRGSVSAPIYAGGIHGGGENIGNCVIQNVYNAGEVITGQEIKGAIAYNRQETDHFSDCYWLVRENHSGVSEGEPLQHSCAFYPTTYYGEWSLDSLQFGHDLVQALNAGAEQIESLYPEVGPLSRWDYDFEEVNDGFPVMVPNNTEDDELEAYGEAPFNFGGSPISDQGTYSAQLWWNKPFASHWFHYDEKPYAGSVYCNHWGIKIPAEEIQIGDVLTHVAFYKAGGQEQTMGYSFAFGFEGEMEPDSWEYLPGNSVQVEPSPDGWVMVKLGSPIVCEEGKCLWIVLTAPNVEGNNAPYCQASGNPNACWSSEGSAAGDWMIRGYFTNDVGYNDPGYNENLDHYNIYRGSSLDELEKIAEVGRDEEEYFDILQQPFGDYYYQLTASYTDGRESAPAKRSENPHSPDYVYFHVGNISSLGSEWYYEIQNENGSITYQHLEYAADTTVNHKDVKIIIRTNTLYDKGGQSVVTREYIYEDFGKVYWWNETLQDFTMLYDLGAQIGDEWEIKVGLESLIMHVDTVEQYEYEGTIYRTLHVSDADNLFSGEIMSGIGHLTSFFPERLMTRGKSYRVEGIRCYWREGELVFKYGDEDCDAVYQEIHNGIEDPVEAQFNVYPNPTNGILVVETQCLASQPSQAYRICNLMGQTVQTGSLNAETQQINVSNLPEGMYFITIGDMTKKFVVNR